MHVRSLRPLSHRVTGTAVLGVQGGRGRGVSTLRLRGAGMSLPHVCVCFASLLLLVFLSLFSKSQGFSI